MAHKNSPAASKNQFFFFSQTVTPAHQTLTSLPHGSLHATTRAVRQPVRRGSQRTIPIAVKATI